VDLHLLFHVMLTNRWSSDSFSRNSAFLWISLRSVTEMHCERLVESLSVRQSSVNATAVQNAVGRTVCFPRLRARVSFSSFVRCAGGVGQNGPAWWGVQWRLNVIDDVRRRPLLAVVMHRCLLLRHDYTMPHTPFVVPFAVNAKLYLPVVLVAASRSIKNSSRSCVIPGSSKTWKTTASTRTSSRRSCVLWESPLSGFNCFRRFHGKHAFHSLLLN